jgi:hypothetical protein
MGWGELLKKLFSSFKTNDQARFIEISEEIISNERRKHHIQLTDYLQRIIRSAPAFLH